MEGKLIVISAPSGSGKTTIVKHILNSDLNIEFSVSACSRKPRTGEKHGHDYYFLPVEDFSNKISQSAFIEWEEVYPGNFYGTLKSELARIWAKGNHVIFDVDVVGGLNIKKQFNKKCLAIFIRPPSVAELEKRLRGRATDSDEIIKKRVEKAEYELTFAKQFDVIVVNDVLEDAIKETYVTIKKFLN